MASRELSISYGSRTIGGASTTCLLDASRGGINIDEGPDFVTVSFEFVARDSTSEAAFTTLLTDLETDMRKPRQRLRIIVGSSTWRDWNPATSDNTGYDHEPELTKVGDIETDSARSVRFRWSCRLQVPADLYGQAGRVNSSYQVIYTPARRKQLVLTGEYRRQSTDTSAVTRYQDNVGAWASTIQSSLGGTWELAEEDYGPNETDTVCQFRRVYDEIIYNQGTSSLNVASIVRQRLAAKASTEWPGDSPGGGATRPAMLEATYSAWVDEDAAGTDIRSIYDDVARPWILQHLKSRFRAAAIGIESEMVSLDADDNRIEASLRVIAPTGAVMEFIATTTTRSLSGIVLEPVWAASRFARLVYQGPATLTRTGTVKTRILGGSGSKGSIRAGGTGSPMGARVKYQSNRGSGLKSESVASLGGAGAFAEAMSPGALERADADTAAAAKKAAAAKSGGGASVSAGQGKYFGIETTIDSTDLIIGDPQRGSILVTDLTTVTHEEWAEPVSVSGGGNSFAPAITKKEALF